MIDRLGATLEEHGRCHFHLWAPKQTTIEVHLIDDGRCVPMVRGSRGVHTVIVDDVAPGARYRFRFADGIERPDPASRHQPEGVHGPSAVVDLAYSWRDAHWRGRDIDELVLYEVHVGTFTPEGTFAAMHPHLARLRALGITAIEIMPVAQFPGERNWGYDGVYPFAVQHSYGGPRELQALVDACHAADLAVVLDVVYNHLGPEGNYLAEFAPYFTDIYRTPWGAAINFDGADSDGVRRYFLENARQWFEDFHIDGLRLDATHAIVDRSAKTFLEELAEVADEQQSRSGRRGLLVAESDANDPALVRRREEHGIGLDAMWCDDFHHAVHALLTGERDGYYADYGSLTHLAEAWRSGLTYAGDYSPFRRRRHGRPFTRFEPEKVVVSVQNHDQIGNRLAGERLGVLMDFESEKLAAGLLLLAPFVPLLFMGQEYGERRPFEYFVSHSDPDLVDAVRRGRREEFASFSWTDVVPDPQAEDTFRRCVLDHASRDSGRHAALYALYGELLQLRSGLKSADADKVSDEGTSATLVVRRGADAVFLFHTGREASGVDLDLGDGEWRRHLDSADERWGGAGACAPALAAGQRTHIDLAPRSFVVYARRS